MWLAHLLFILGWMLVGLSAAHLPALMIALANSNEAMVGVFLSSAATSAFVGLGLVAGFRGMPGGDDRRTAIFIPILIWVVVPFFAGLPFFLSGAYPTVGAAYFEAVSGLTTTGATAISDPAVLPATVLFWRSFLEWLGGLSVLVVAATVFLRLNVGGYQVIQGGFPTGEGSSLPAQLRNVFAELLPVYSGVTALCCGLLWATGEPFSGALQLALSTISTGGFTARPGGLAVIGNPWAEFVLVVFMVVGATSWALHHALLRRRGNPYAGRAEIRVALKFLVAITVVLVAVQFLQSGEFETPALLATIWNSIYVVVSAFSTTGFVPEGAVDWPLATGIVVMALVFLGGTTMSTSGGLKLMRAMLLFRHIRQELRRLGHPHISAPILYEGREVTERDLAGIWFLFLSMLLAIGIGALVLAITGLAFPEALTTAVAATTNAGPAGYLILPGFAGYADMAGSSQTAVLILMILGRVESVLLLAVLARSLSWR